MNQVKSNSRNIYFTTRKWGFGSNIVNYLKAALFCSETERQLVLQDRNNTISEDFELFSVVQLPHWIKRTNSIVIIPIENLKTLVKFILNKDYSLYDRVTYSLVYWLGRKKEIFLNDFNSNRAIKTFFAEEYKRHVGGKFLELWRYTSEVTEIFNGWDKTLSLEGYKPDIAIQIRGGDKVLEIENESSYASPIDKYIDVCIKELNNLEIEAPEIYIMTDTHSYFLEIKRKMKALLPNAKLRSCVKEDQGGYFQQNFNDSDLNSKIEQYHFFLYELEFLRKSKVSIGSYYSNIFYLASLLPYKKSTKFISVDISFEKSYL
jgi:hypothetical protein